MLLRRPFWLLALGSLSHTVVAQIQPQEEEHDLLSFVTIPNVRALKYDVEYNDRERVAPGYWFVSPYGQMDLEAPTHRYVPFQIGPYIYDQDGNLIWVGSDMFHNRNVFDFRAVHSIGDEPHLSFIVQHGQSWDNDEGSGIILTNDYEIKHRLTYPEEEHLGAFDIHEFLILNDGKTALAIAYPIREVSMADFDRPDENTNLLAGGFTVLDIDSGDLKYHWESFDKISLTESYRYGPDSAPAPRPGWDYIHANAVDRNADGNYIMSMRFTNTIYMISGEDGHIMWRLGGKTSDFDMDFTFSRQHDVKFLESNGTHHVISMLNNASDEQWTGDEDVSSALVIEIDEAAKTAKVIRRYNRPDGGFTRLRGNAQVLPNGNMFVGWSETGYISEHTEDGDLLMTARFASDRFNTYRAYKCEFTGRPHHPPAVVSSAVGTSERDLTTTFYVSWNGATDVATWKFYAKASEHSDSVFIGQTARADFETMYVAQGYLDWVHVDAVDGDGNVLGTSPVRRTQTPRNWKAAGFRGDASTLTPSNPVAMAAPAEAEQDGTNIGAPDAASAAHAQDVKEILEVADHTHSLLQMIGGLLLFILLLGFAYAIVFVVCPPFKRRQKRLRQQYQSKVVDGEEYVGLQSVPPQ